MHFLFFAAQYLPTSGGVERYTSDLAQTLTGMGHQCTVVTSALPGLPATGEEDGIRVFRLPSHLLMNGRFPVIHKNKQFKQIINTIFDINYDYSVINTRFYPLSLWAARQCKKRGIPALVLEHGTKHLSLDNPLLNIAGNAYEHLAMKYVRHFCNNFYAVSKAGTNWLRHFHVAAKGVLYNAVNAQRLATLAAGAPYSFRQRYSMEENAPLIAFVGRLIVEKGVNELLAAFALLRQAMPAARLIMAGGGPLLAGLQAANHPGVVLAGELPHEESVALLDQCDVFCLPTYSEGFSTTVLEAAALGCCIVTTPTGGSPELIQNEKSGILLKDKAPDTILDALLTCLNSDSIRNNYAASVQYTLLNKFTWSKTAQTLVGIAEAQQNPK